MFSKIFVGMHGERIGISCWYMNEKSLALNALSKEFKKCLKNETKPLQGAGELFPALLRSAHPQALGWRSEALTPTTVIQFSLIQDYLAFWVFFVSEMIVTHISISISCGKSVVTAQSKYFGYYVLKLLQICVAIGFSTGRQRILAMSSSKYKSKHHMVMVFVMVKLQGEEVFKKSCNVFLGWRREHCPHSESSYIWKVGNSDASLGPVIILFSCSYSCLSQIILLQ